MAAPKCGRDPIEREEALIILREVDRALALHTRWLKTLHRILVCSEPAPAADLAEDAHRQCSFGQWYGNLPRSLLTGETGIGALGEPHRRMHDMARALLLRHGRREAIDPQAYESFIDVAFDFKQKMRVYQLELVQRVCAVDHLTGVWNRNLMVSHLEAEAERARRDHKDVAICLLDIDHFKRVNDQFGHPVGDEVLHSMAQFLKDNLRTYDSMFRYGGEEFLICLPDTTLERAKRLLDRLRKKLAVTQVCAPPHDALRITASFGVTALTPECSISEAIERADHALLYVKANGRNDVCAWDLAGEASPLPDHACD